MNSNLTLGSIVFLLWSSLSGWYYVCQIKGLCFEPGLSSEKVDESFPVNEGIPKTIEAKAADTTSVVAEVSVPSVIDITEQKIYFTINSTKFLDQTYVENFTNNLKNEIEGRDVEINIVGFTCDIGKARYNLELGLKRAKAMQAFLNANDIYSSKFEVISLGEIPSKENTDEERQKNRKVTITIKSID